MIRYIKHKDIDKKKWDDCIMASPNGLVYALSWYLDIAVKEWDAFVEDDYASVFPIVYKKKYGISYAIQPAWIQQLGLFSKLVISSEKTFEFLKLALAKTKYIDINLNTLNKLPVDNKFFSVKENNNYLLDLIAAYQHISKSYSTNLKRNLTKSSDRLSLIDDVSYQEIIKIFRKNRGADIKVLKEENYQTLTNLVFYARSINVAKVFGVADETNALIGGAIFMIAKGRAIMIFSAVNSEGREKGAMPFLIDSFIRMYEQNNLVLDFEGSNDENLARFYKGFGAMNSPYLRIRKSKITFIKK